MFNLISNFIFSDLTIKISPFHLSLIVDAIFVLGIIATLKYKDQIDILYNCIQSLKKNCVTFVKGKLTTNR